MLRKYFLGAAALAILSISQADAAITISKRPTQGFSCSGGVCTAIARHANMNATDLDTMLASSDITVANGVLTKDIDVNAALSWASTNRLTLDSRHSVSISNTISVTGTGSVTVKLNDGGSDGELNFYPKGQISFADTSSNFVLDNIAFTLVADLETLESDIEGNPSGDYALARSYNAGPDGVYSDDPIPTIFQGYFEGLGNSIRNLKIKSTTTGTHAGLFYATDQALVRDLHLVNVKIQGGKQSSTGALAGLCTGSITNVDVSGRIGGGLNSYVGGVCGVATGLMLNVQSSGSVFGKGDNGTTQNAAGGLAGLMQGTIGYSSSSAAITGAKGWTVGGLAGQSTGSLNNVSATGTVLVGDNGIAGGLLGSNISTSHLTNAYATGFVSGGVSSTVGGFIGLNNGPVSASYSSGAVASGSGNAVGGFIGNDTGTNDLTNTYWDISSSGQSHGVGSDTAYPGVTGLTTEQFQAGLPDGFLAVFWAEDPAINGGLPYLVSTPPG